MDNANDVGRLNERWSLVDGRRRRRGGRWEKRDVGGHTRSFPAGSELCARAKGVSRQPEGVTPAYSYAGNEGNSRGRAFTKPLVRPITSRRAASLAANVTRVELVSRERADGELIPSE